MNRIVLIIYDWLRKHRAAGWTICAMVTAVLLVLASTLDYKEDISDFLPLDKTNREALDIYQKVSGADRIYAIVSMRDTTMDDPERLVSAVDSYKAAIDSLDTDSLVGEVVTRIDLEQIMDMSENLYGMLPYFLTDEDYARADSLLALPGYVEARMEANKELLQFPTGGFSVTAMQHDPLALFGSVTEKLQNSGSSMRMDSYDGYILTPDGKRAVAIIVSGFGARESDRNGDLVKLLERAGTMAEASSPEIDISIVGGPVIAVENASRIKKDSIIAVAIAALLIVALLIYVFRSVVNILLIFLSVGWGFLFAMGCIALHYDSVSVIVLGISSVILGIAINYPLHVIDHLKEHGDRRLALREIVSPLVVGNITTVGAFLCLVPLNATALHDLGLFSSLLLVGTILFVLVFLPQLVKRVGKEKGGASGKTWLSLIADVRPEKSRVMVWAVVLLTAFFAFFSFDTGFDSDMRNINYMSRQIREDMEYFCTLTVSGKDTEELFVVSRGTDWEEVQRANDSVTSRLAAMERDGRLFRRGDMARFLPSKAEQERRLKLWEEFGNRHSDIFRNRLPAAQTQAGFSSDAFAGFSSLLDSHFSPVEFAELRDMFGLLFANSVIEESDGSKALVQTVDVPAPEIAQVSGDIRKNFGGLCFDVRSMNASIAGTISDDFNYICMACGFIVFVFLWLSLGRLELAVISFLPMALSWIWILGIMALADIRFNIVNIILASFIFGQGDDYTIFITEGLSYEYAYRRKVLASYKNSIVVSALIMFIGIGTLVFAEHPAMKSLGEITVIGMTAVVLMAYLIPPLLFRWLTHSGRHRRVMPLTLMNVLRRKRYVPLAEVKTVRDARPWVMGRYIYKGFDIEMRARRAMKEIVARSAEIESLGENAAICVDAVSGNGELALTIALIYPRTMVYARFASEDARLIFEACADGFVSNVKIVGEDGQLPDFKERALTLITA